MRENGTLGLGSQALAGRKPKNLHQTDVTLRETTRPLETRLKRT